MKTTKLLAALALTLTLSLGACGGDDTTTPSERTAGPAESAAPAPEPTGEVIEVKMVTDGAGNYFEPAEITAGPGDVVRFVLVSGVHNVSFPGGQNGGAASLPEASPYLQLPGQTHDLVVGLAPGTYTFQCDPHAALGMVGTLTVR